MSHNTILLKQLNEYKKPFLDNPNLSKETTSKSKQDPITIKLIDFEFYPKKLTINVGTIIEWNIGANKSLHSSIYDYNDRCFYLSIEELGVQSPQLWEGSTFSYCFMEEGIYEVACLNYSRIKCLITVVKGEIKQKTNSKVSMFYNQELILEENLEEKRKNKNINEKKTYLSDFPHTFFDQIDQDNELNKTLENEILNKNDHLQSDTRINEIVEENYFNNILTSNEITQKINFFKEGKDLHCLIKKAFLFNKCLDINEIENNSSEEKEIYKRVQDFLILRWEMDSFCLK